jgi:N-acetylglucosamine-6-phosphate deacetylase
VSSSRRLGVAHSFDGRRLVPGDVEVDHGTVTAVGLPPARSGIAAPGWLDLQVNGFAGVDVLRAGEADLRRLARELPRTGVTGFLATLITAPVDDVRAAAAAAQAVRERPDPGSAAVLGTHHEGPCLSPSFAGAHPPGQLCADEQLLAELAALPGVRMVTLAPEELPSPALVSRLAADGLVVSIGHTAATAAEAHAAFDAGARALTHAFNAHRLLASREPGPLAAALVRDDTVITVIADGVHVARDNLALLDRIAAGRLALVTDAIVAAGLADGGYRFGPLEVTVNAGRASLSDGTLAGSVATMDACVRCAADVWGLERALAAASGTPARLLGDDRAGAVAVGRRADVVVLDHELTVIETLVGGRTAFRR